MLRLCTPRTEHAPTHRNFSRHLHKGPQTRIGVMFAAVFAKAGLFPTFCANFPRRTSADLSRDALRILTRQQVIQTGASACARSSIF